MSLEVITTIVSTIITPILIGITFWWTRKDAHNTRKDLSNDIRGTRKDLSNDIRGTRKDLSNDIRNTRKDLSNDIRDIRKEIHTIKTKITNFAERIGNLEGSFSEHMGAQHNATQSESPVTLSDIGKKILKDSNAREYLDDNFEEFYEELKDSENNYILQQKSKDVLRKKINELSRIYGDYLYDNSENVHTLIITLGVVLRDMVIEKKQKQGSKN